MLRTQTRRPTMTIAEFLPGAVSPIPARVGDRERVAS
jgi:hypothetical protein